MKRRKTEMTENKTKKKKDGNDEEHYEKKKDGNDEEQDEKKKEKNKNLQDQSSDLSSIINDLNSQKNRLEELAHKVAILERGNTQSELLPQDFENIPSPKEVNLSDIQNNDQELAFQIHHVKFTLGNLCSQADNQSDSIEKLHKKYSQLKSSFSRLQSKINELVENQPNDQEREVPPNDTELSDSNKDETSQRSLDNTPVVAQRDRRTPSPSRSNRSENRDNSDSDFEEKDPLKKMKHHIKFQKNQISNLQSRVEGLEENFKNFKKILTVILFCLIYLFLEMKINRINHS